jgi:hypothetical protein
VGIGNGLRGHYAMLYDADTGEPWDTGSASFSDANQAYAEARAWGDAEGLPYDLPPPTAPPAARRAYTGIGSRETPPEMLTRMRELAAKLAGGGWVLRSGAAPGADSAFEAGAPENLREIYLPWDGFQRSSSPLVIRSLPVFEQAMAIASEHHPAWSRLSRPSRLLMARNACQVLGTHLNEPSRFLVCWAPQPVLDTQGRVKNALGGSGLAIRLAYAHGVPVFHLGIDKHLQRIEAFLNQ